MSLLKSVGFAWKGLRVAWKEQRNLKIHTAITCGVVALGIWLDIAAVDWCILLLTIGVVLSAELINTAIENLTNLVSPEQHPLAGKVKDIAAAAVLVLAVISIFVGVIVFWKYV